MSDAVKPAKGPAGEPRKVDPQKQQQRKTLMAAIIMAVPVLAFLYFLFSDPTAQTDSDAFNSTLPEGKSEGIVASKQQAIERVRLKETEPVSTLGDRFTLTENESYESDNDPASEISRSEQAYREATRQMSGFYSQPAYDPQVEELKEQVAALTARLEQVQTVQKPDPLEIAEQQFALASKYLGGAGKSQPVVEVSSKTEKIVPVPVRRPVENVVTTLSFADDDG